MEKKKRKRSKDRVDHLMKDPTIDNGNGSMACKGQMVL